MDSRSDATAIPSASETARGGNRGEEAESLKSVDSAPLTGEIDASGCLTQAYLDRVLPPIPDWMREAPKPKERTLFD